MSTPEHFPINDRIYAAFYLYSQADESTASQPDSTSQTESPRESDLLDPLVPSLPLAEAEIHAAIQESRHMLERLRAHPLFIELDSARKARHHEVRYDLPDGRGIMDLLYRIDTGWFIIDFKTDDVRSDAEAQPAISQNGYDRQVARYAQAISNQLKVEAKTRLVFLNVKNNLVIFDL